MDFRALGMGLLGAPAGAALPENIRRILYPDSPTVAGKPGIDTPPGTLNSVLKQAGLKK
jgi:hypothetical protein